jgi:hypothetical protein
VTLVFLLTFSNDNFILFYLIAGQITVSNFHSHELLTGRQQIIIVKQTCFSIIPFYFIIVLPPLLALYKCSLNNTGERLNPYLRPSLITISSRPFSFHFVGVCVFFTEILIRIFYYF